MVEGPKKVAPIERLRALSASNPKQARDEFGAIVLHGGEMLDETLLGASSPGDSRLRNVIANVYKADVRASALEVWLRKWLEVETDEFTRSAIEAALVARQPAPMAKPTSRGQPANLVDAYRFVSDRLCHRIRNAMTLPNASMSRLEFAIAEVVDGELKSELLAILAGMKTGFSRIARSVEFDTGDDYLTWQNISPISWLTAKESSLSARFGEGRLVIAGSPAIRQAKIRATPFLLETIFGNLWSNAIQASDLLAMIELRCAIDVIAGKLQVTVLDNGGGFSEAHLETAFQQPYSTKSDSRGRGLLEIADAIARLQGTVGLVRQSAGDLRVQMILPIAGS
jgi:signal transduction histidine kinase